MNKKLALSIVMCGTLLSACATQSIQQGKDLSSSGIAYTNAVDNLLAITTDKVIDFDSAELKKTRRGSNLRDMINAKNDGLIDLVAELNRFRSQTKLLKIYFFNLQALADSPVKDDAGEAVKSLSNRISKLNKKLGKKNGTESLSDDQKEQIGALTGLVANTLHAAKIKRALKRDAEVIGTYLALQEMQLANLTDILQSRFQAENDLLRNEKINAPYIDKNNPLPPSWLEDRKQWVKAQFVNEQLNTAKEAAKHLQIIWNDILLGKPDINSLSLLISDLNEFVTTAQALEAAK